VPPREYKIMDDDQFRQILNKFDLSWSGYRKVRKGVKKRITRHMTFLSIRTANDLLDALDHDIDLKQQLEHLLTVSISRFFRDRKLWQDLETHVLPALVRMSDTKAGVWSAGCACGEEVYSIAIVWDRFACTMENPPELELIATDSNPDVLGKAKTGVYSKSSLKEVDTGTLERYFTPAADRFKVRDFLKKRVVWQAHDMITDAPPPGEFPLIFLRNNLLTYYGKDSMEASLHKILSRLAPGGFLVIGAHERIPPQFQEVSETSFNKAVMQKQSP
jgi:chemotaxis protein methyltransferase CheR